MGICCQQSKTAPPKTDSSIRGASALPSAASGLPTTFAQQRPSPLHRQRHQIYVASVLVVDIAATLHRRLLLASKVLNVLLSFFGHHTLFLLQRCSYLRTSPRKSRIISFSLGFRHPKSPTTSSRRGGAIIEREYLWFSLLRTRQSREWSDSRGGFPRRRSRLR